MTIDNRLRMVCDHCGKLIGLVAPDDIGVLGISSQQDECHNCRSKRLNREASNEAKKGT